MADNEPTRVWNRRFIHLVCIEGCLQFGCFFTRPIMSNYAIFLGAAIAIAGVIAGLNMTTALVFRPITGWLSDRFNKKTLMCISAGVFSFVSFGYFFSFSIPLLGFFCAIQGIAFALKTISVTSIAVLVVPRNKVGSGISWISLMNTAATAAGPAISMAIVDYCGFQYCFLISAILLVCGFALAVAFKMPAATTASLKTNHQATREGACRSRSLTRFLQTFIYIPALPLTAIMSLLSIPHGSISALILTTQDMGFIQAGSLYFAAYAAVAVVSKPMAGRLSDNLGPIAIAVPGLSLTTLGIVLLALMPSIGTTIVMGALMGLGQCSTQCALQAESVRGVDIDHIGRASNTYYLGADIGMGFGPFISGTVLQNFGPAPMFEFEAICIALSLILTLILFRGTRQSNKRFH